MPTRILVSDTNLWIDLHRAGLTQLVFGLPFEFIATEFVLRELDTPNGSELQALGLQTVLLEGSELLTLYDLKQSLNNSSLADVSSYYVAKREGWTLVTGDGAVRKAAQENDVDVRGVLWVLDELYDSEIASGAILACALETMLQAKARLPKVECRKRISHWRQSK